MHKSKKLLGKSVFFLLDGSQNSNFVQGILLFFLGKPLNFDLNLPKELNQASWRCSDADFGEYF